MNCATPCAPLRLTARGSNLLSCQIKRVKNSIGSSLAAAADCTAKQIDSRLGGSPGARILSRLAARAPRPGLAGPGRHVGALLRTARAFLGAARAFLRRAGSLLGAGPAEIVGPATRRRCRSAAE